MDMLKFSFSPVRLLASIRSSLIAFLLPLAAFLAAPSFTQAAQVVFVSTDESEDIRTNAVAAFQAQAGAASLSFLDAPGVLSTPGAAPQLPITADTRLIVVLSIYTAIDNDRMAELNGYLMNSNNIEVVAFIDSCDICDKSNLARVLTQVNLMKPTTWGTLTTGSDFLNGYTAHLNPYSPYAGSFTAGLSTMEGYYYTPIENVPLQYALYTQNTLPSPAPPSMSPVNDTVGLFIPKAASNNGTGACLFLTSDTSMFDTIPGIIPVSQYNLIASSFISAATSATGACAQPKWPPSPNNPTDGQTAVPTLSEATLALLALMLAAGAGVGMRLRRSKI